MGIDQVPYAGLLTAAQFGFTALVVLTLDRCDMLTPKLESMNFAKLKQMTPITCIFYMAIFSNTKILQFAHRGAVHCFPLSHAHFCLPHRHSGAEPAFSFVSDGHMLDGDPGGCVWLCRHGHHHHRRGVHLGVRIPGHHHHRDGLRQACTWPCLHLLFGCADVLAPVCACVCLLAAWRFNISCWVFAGMVDQQECGGRCGRACVGARVWACVCGHTRTHTERERKIRSGVAVAVAMEARVVAPLTRVVPAACSH